MLMIHFINNDAKCYIKQLVVLNVSDNVMTCLLMYEAIARLLTSCCGVLFSEVPLLAIMPLWEFIPGI
jgi:hypothetical protein